MTPYAILETARGALFGVYGGALQWAYTYVYRTGCQVHGHAATLDAALVRLTVLEALCS